MLILTIIKLFQSWFEVQDQLRTSSVLKSCMRQRAHSPFAAEVLTSVCSHVY